MERNDMEKFRDCKFLSTELKEAIVAGRSVLLEGSAGVGKSTQVMDLLKSSYSVLLTSTTGISAINIGGITIHSATGIGTCEDQSDFVSLISKKSFKSNTAPMLKKCDILVIDEISMMVGSTLDLVDAMFRVATQVNKPFGGKVVVMTGDLFQLPPATKRKKNKWCFESVVWKEMNPLVISLTKIWRQVDKDLIESINKMRFGMIDDSVVSCLSSSFNREFPPEIEAVKLRSLNRDVDRINQEEYSKLRTEERVYYMSVTDGSHDGNKQARKDFSQFREVRLKAGSRIFTAVNNPKEGYMNGSLGVVIDFSSEDEPIVEFDNGETITVSMYEYRMTNSVSGALLAKVSMMPIKYAWGLSIHRSQGMTLEYVDVDISGVFLPGMAYVGISRCKSIGGLSIRGWNEDIVYADTDVSKFYLENVL